MTETIETSVTPTRDSVWKWRGWADVGVLLAVVPITLAGVRILVYAGGDPVLLRSLVQSLDVMTVVLGTLLPLLPLFLWLIFQTFIADPITTRRIFGSGRRRTVMIVVTIIVAGIYLLTAPWSQAVSFLIGIGLAFLTYWSYKVYRFYRRKHPRKIMPEASSAKQTAAAEGESPESWFSRHTWIAPVVAIAFVMILPQGMWLPEETIMTTSGKTVSGYVLQTTTDWTTVMTSNKTVNIYATNEIAHRSVCDQGEHVSLATMIAGQPTKSATCAK